MAQKMKFDDEIETKRRSEQIKVQLVIDGKPVQIVAIEAWKKAVEDIAKFHGVDGFKEIVSMFMEEIDRGIKESREKIEGVIKFVLNEKTK